MLRLPPSPRQPTLRCQRSGFVAAAALAGLCCAQVLAQSAPAQKPALPPPGARIVLDAGEAELRVDGVPFFIHAAQFDYFRIPKDLWGSSLDRYRELGINTVDLRIPWNWHELRDAEFDFDGRTNPRRDLRDLLHLIAEKRLKLIVRPGPLLADHWRNAGLPDWLLAYSEYGMDAVSIAAGAGPSEADLAAQDADEAASQWLENETHMTYTRRWFTALARELAPYGSGLTLRVTEPGDREGETREKEISGPLLLVALGDGMGVRPGQPATDLSRYFAELQRALARGGLDAISFVSASEISAVGVAPLSIETAPGKESQVGLAAKRVLPPAVEQNAAQRSKKPPLDAATEFAVSAEEGISLKLLATTLATEPAFPPFLSDFATSRFAPPDDVRAAQPSPANTLLASRLLIGVGLRGIEYSPLQDTLTPAGWETPSAPRYFRWDAALDLAGNKGARAEGVKRNGQLLSEWGAMLAASHLRADFGIVDPRTSLARLTEAQAAQATRALEQMFRVTELAGFSPELVNPAAQPVERLLRDSVILLPAIAGIGGNQLSNEAQTALVEFVRRGGVLVSVSSPPTSLLPPPLRQGAPAAPPAGETPAGWAFERGRVIVSPGDFSSWVSLDSDLDHNRRQPEATQAIETLNTLTTRAGAARGVQRMSVDGSKAELFATQLISNEVSPGAGRPSCAADQLCAAALVSVTNFGDGQPAAATLAIEDIQHASPGRVPRTISLEVTVPAHDSLLLPIHAPLCSAAAAEERCSDEVVAAGAELLGAQRDGKTLELLFYAPARATVRLNLESQPSKIELDEDIRLESQWKQETGEAEVVLLRGAAPDFLRVLKVHLRYTPHVVEKQAPPKHPRSFTFEVFNAVKFPLGSDASISTQPPLILADAGTGGNLVVSSRNSSEAGRLVDFSLNGAFHGTNSARIFPGEQDLTRLRFQPTRVAGGTESTPTASSDGLLHGELGIHSGRSQTGGPVVLVTPGENKTIHYQYDFDRDGALESVLESNRLRLIVSPADGGRALALVDKSTSEDLITFGGALYDRFDRADADPVAKEAGDLPSNREYQAEWVEEKQGTALRLTYDHPEIAPMGTRIEKTVRLVAADAVEISYRISRATTGPAEPEDSSPSEQPLLSMLSVPLARAGDAPARFCWEPPPASSGPAVATGALAKPAPDPHCEDITPSRDPILIPEDISRFEIQTAGHSTLAVEWTSSRARIVPKNFSAQVEFAFPLPARGAAPGEFTLRYTIPSGP
jgi:hypothetical protein